MTSLIGPGGVRLDVETSADGTAVRISIRGDADVANLEHLDAALSGIGLDGETAVRIDLADLDFIDVAALRRLTRFATRMTESGRQVRTVGAPPLLREIVRILPARDQLGLA